jgi:hypothetical protein
MSILKNLFITVIGFLFLSSCATTSNTLKRLDSQWTGKNFDEFVLKNGSPYREFSLKNGDILYTWNSGISSVDMPQYATTNIYGNTAYTNFSGGGSIKMYCEIQLQVGINNRIKKVKILKDTFGKWVPSRCHETLE